MAKLPLPADTQALVDALRPQQWHVVGVSTLNIAPIIADARIESATDADVKKHVARWERFRVKLERRPHLLAVRPMLRPMFDDIRAWEASKAGIRLADESRRAWFWQASAKGRLELVRDETRRRIEERRFKLTKARLKILAKSEFYFDGRRN